jgi:4-hydroxybenzoate polyprenyltransferase
MNFIRLKIQSKRLSILLLLIGFALAIVFASNALTPFFPIMIVSLGAITAYVTLKDEMIWPLKLVVIVLDVLGVIKVLQIFHSLA